MVGSAGFASTEDLAFDLDGALYGAGTGGLLRIDPLSGAGVLVGSFGISPASIYGLEIDERGDMYAFAGESAGALVADVYAVDKVTGAATLVGSIANASSLGLNGASFVATCGFGKDGPSSSPSPLTLEWTEGIAPIYVNGSLRAAGGTPLGPGLLLATLGKFNTQAGSPGALVAAIPFSFDGVGELVSPLSASQIVVPGGDLFMLVFAAVPLPRGSNGLRLRPCK